MVDTDGDVADAFYCESADGRTLVLQTQLLRPLGTAPYEHPRLPWDWPVVLVPVRQGAAR